MDEIVIKENKKKRRGIIPVGIFLVLLSLYILAVGLIELGLLPLIVGSIGTLYFGTALLYSLKTVLFPSPLIVIGEKGITDNSTASSVGFIGWEEIELIFIKKHYQSEYIVIKVYDLDKLMRRIPPLKRLAMKANLLFKYPPVSILASIADVNPERILSMMQNRLEKYRKNK